jgi:hypothetical protein
MLSTNFSEGVINKIPNNVTEQDVLYLQKIFLEPGFHDLKVSNFKESRKFISLVLNSLRFYKNVGCLTIQSDELQKEFDDIYGKLVLRNYSIDPETSLINFFLDEFDYDFIIIEKTDELANCTMSKIFEQYLLDFHINRMIPIINVY